MKKHTFLLKHYPNYLMGYGLINHPCDAFTKLVKKEEYIDAFEIANKYCNDNGFFYESLNIRTEQFPYKPERKNEEGIPLGDCFIELDIYYHNRDSLLEENKQLKKDLKAINEKYNGKIY